MPRDDYDDRNRDRDRDDDDRRDDRDDIARAKRLVSAPSLMLIISSAICLLLVVVGLVVAFTSPYLFADWYQKTLIDAQPPGAQKDQLQAQFDKQKEQMRLDNPVDLTVRSIALVFNLLALIGGFKMRSLSGYGLAMTGSVMAIIPISGCCLLTLPMGIWAVVVLNNADVKRGFKAKQRERAGGGGDSDRTDDYDRDDRR